MKRPSTPPAPPITYDDDNQPRHVTIIIDPSLHRAMKMLASRRRSQVGLLYEEAIEAYLNKTNNYLGKKGGK